MTLLYSLAALTSSLLLFLIQPMFAKMTLPLMGGTPAVWNTAMVFYQVVLLLGYAYAHFSTRYFNIKLLALLHVLLLLIAFAFLPITVAELPASTSSSINTRWLLQVYALSIGVPFFLVSTIAPLLQKWFSQTSNRHADNPYFLYSASNVGSFVALLAYPVLVEPYFGLKQQGAYWSYFFAFLVCVIALCAFALHKQYKPNLLSPGLTATTPMAQKLRWIAFAFIPSSLMLSVTTHITTDMGSSPFMWIIPLALYLLTFVIVFSRKPVLKHDWMVKLQSYLLLLVPILLFQQLSDYRVYLLLHLITFFTCAMVCHGEMVKIRPAAARLTEFYLFMSIGGALGGIFTAIVSPLVFDSVYEYPIGFVLACLARPVLQDGLKGRIRNDFLLPLVFGISVYAAFKFGMASDLSENAKAVFSKALLFASALAVFSFSIRPLRFGAGMAVLIYLGLASSASGTLHTLETDRNFFGVKKIQSQKSPDLVLLRHGTTIHGAQQINSALWREPISYYNKDGPVGTVFGELNRLGQIQNVGIVGLGLGIITCYRQPGQNWRVFEIDDLVVSIAKDTQYFHYLEQCGPDVPIVIGDARLSLQDEPDNFYDLLVIDAFSSDSIPVHLLTKEALLLYMSKLSARGRLLLHISNKHLNLAPVLGNVMVNNGYSGRIQFFAGDKDNYLVKQSAIWVVMSRNEESVDFLSSRKEWRKLPTDKNVGNWTDDFSNLYRSLIWNQL